ncbi:alkaline phosphatase family protein [Streptomyces sp. Li-HN-5-11]|uniref:alkaline phosphatase family protein n=1 Tax=Streptomyces sp. Li-HN-5-11 TaxID=3075432 RepID=UPI0028AADDE0|nr:alkaline phosphatase family protein [Streptomyces sp. Li-HN-5-11]WNM34677.1 alkaline phosphatase family protein [Streptomyces sp. Li-HN-5-11]
MASSSGPGCTGRRCVGVRPVLASAVALTAAAVWLWTGLGGSSSAATRVPTPEHVVVVVFENRAYGQVIGSAGAPYINALRTGGANLTRFHSEAHWSQPNYFALFSGSTQGIKDDSCYRPGFSSAPNLASEQLAAGRSWASYNESLPGQGSTRCSSGAYARKHNPWFGFRNVPASSAKPFAQFPKDYSKLPQLSFVIPDLCSDMHDCPVSTGDTWLKEHLGAYATWARAHDSLLVVTFDEGGDPIPTVLYGRPVTPGSSSSTTYDDYDLLRTLEDTQGLTTHAGKAATARDVTGIWAP